MLKESYPYYLASEPHYANTDLDVTNKYTGEVATQGGDGRCGYHR